MQDSSEIPSLVEPLFITLNASVAPTPVMNLADLGAGLAAAAADPDRAQPQARTVEKARPL